MRPSESSEEAMMQKEFWETRILLRARSRLLIGGDLTVLVTAVRRANPRPHVKIDFVDARGAQAARALRVGAMVAIRERIHLKLVGFTGQRAEVLVQSPPHVYVDVVTE
jgi:sRNA-binding carbon storage regulator CsrA